MLRSLLCACAIMLSLPGISQHATPESSSPSETVREDPGRVISNLVCAATGVAAAVLTWTAKGEIPDFFVVERSIDGVLFDVISVINKPGSGNSFQWVDDAPKKGRNFYRVRYSFRDGQPLFSQTVGCTVEGAASFKFYPNPADNILIVKSDSPIDVQIADGSGKVRIAESKVQGLRTINVSNLEKGVYLIRFSNKLTNVTSQDKLVKN